MLSLFHQLGRGHDGVDPEPRQDRGDVVQMGLGHGHESIAAQELAGEAIRRRDCQRARIFHEGLRCLRRSHPQWR